MKHYETIGGLPSRGITFAKLVDHLREAQECCALLGHLHNTENNSRDKLIGQGWLLVAELLRKMQHQVTSMAQGKIIQ